MKTEGDSKGINIASRMLIHFCDIVLTNRAMCVMLNIVFLFIYSCKLLIITIINSFVMVFDGFINESICFSFCKC